MKTTKLLIDCKDEIGLIAKVTDILFKMGLNIVVNDEFADKATGRFFMRTELDKGCRHQELLTRVNAVVPEDARVKVKGPEKKKIVIMVTKEPYCLGELLVRCIYGDTQAEVLAVIGNHDNLRPLTEGFGVPFYLLAHKDKSREVYEAELIKLLDRFAFDYLLLAKYMRILSPEFVNYYHTERIINIHHSFLPAFVGAKPYKQAYDRGVKIIGATSHFVNNNLDEGPIIVQDVTHVEHSHEAHDMARAGRAVEKRVLTKALNLVCEDRVFIVGNKTIIFE